MPEKADIFARLRQEMLSLQGFPAPALPGIDALGLGRINAAFPNGVFPRAALHEFVCGSPEGAAASGAFISGIMAALMRQRGAALWIGQRQRIYPPALRTYGIRPEQVLFLYVQKEKEAVWALEEALRCSALSAVVGELRGLDFMASRRLQLAIEGSGVPCFVLRPNTQSGATAAVTRWEVQPLQSDTGDGLPGLGHPRWQVRLLKVRNGRPGSWNVEWKGGRFRTLEEETYVQAQTKTG